MQYIAIRLDLPYADEEKLVKFLNNEKISRYIYAKEIAPKSKKEHFHVVIETEYHRDTVRRKVSKIHPWEHKSHYCVQIVKDLIKSIAYTMKDGDWNKDTCNFDCHHIALAQEYCNKIVDEMKHKTLKDKCLNYLNTHMEQPYWNMNQELMMVILQWFKDKELNYPAQHWIKNVMVTYWMQHPCCEFQQKNIGKLYCINDTFIEI